MDTYRASDAFVKKNKSPLTNAIGNIKKNKADFIALFSVIMVAAFGFMLLSFQPTMFAYWIGYFIMFAIIYIIYTVIAQIIMMITEDPECNSYNESLERHKALCNKYKVWYIFND